MASTSPAIEDYLKTIYAHTEWQPDPITPSALAARLSVAPSSVTEMVKKLAAQGLVAHRPYSAIALTDAGHVTALAVVRRHRLVETWLVTEMGYGWDAVHDEAEVLEHAISDTLLEAIDARLGRPQRDPHGDAIPQADGSVPECAWQRLDDLRSGSSARVLRISDRDPGLLRRLFQADVRPGTEVEVTDAGVRTPTASLRLSADDRAAIWVEDR